MEHSENAKDKVLFLVERFNDLKGILVDGLLDIATTPETKLWIMTILTDNELLPFGSWISECPKSMYEWLDAHPEYPERYSTVTFRKMLDSMTNGKALEHPELTDEFFDYIKEHRIIGTVIDW